jgi:hypothetical protein
MNTERIFAFIRVYLCSSVAIFCCLLAARLPACGGERPRVVLVLCDALTFDDFHDNAYPHLYQLAETGAIGLMNGAVAGPKTPTAATLTLAAGQHVPAEPTDEQAANGGEAVSGERGTAAEVYARRAGPLGAQPAPPGIFHLGVASLRRRGLDTERLGAALAQAKPPIRAELFGNADTDAWGRRAALLTADAVGVGKGVIAMNRSLPESPFGMADDPIRLAQAVLESEADFVAAQLGDTARAEAARPRLSPADYRAARSAALRRLDIFLYFLTEELKGEERKADVLLVSPYPPADDARHPTAWNRLTPALAFGPRFPPGLLTSATTRTPGLLANVDIAPTVLHLFDAPVPPTMIGRPVHSVSARSSGPARIAAVTRMDYLATLNQRALTAVTVPLGAACFLGVLLGMIARRRGGGTASRRFAPCLIFTQNLPTALLFAPLLVPPTLLEYGLRIAAWMLGLMALCYLLSRLLRISPPVVTAFLALFLVATDILTGQHLLKDSLLSGYPLSGIRYYGVGNEYLGVLIGFALAGGFAWLDGPHPPAPSPAPARSSLGRGGEGLGQRKAVLLLTWLILMLLLGWPGLGANAGSLAATGAGFGVGAAILWGRRPTLRLGAAGVVAGLLLALAFGALDAALAAQEVSGSAASSHFGAAIQAAAGGRGAGYLAEIALRKAAMNLRLLASLWLLLAASAVVVTMLAARALIGDALQDVLKRRTWMARGLAATLAAGVASLLFKDSGVVTVTFLAGSQCVLLLYYALTE